MPPATTATKYCTILATNYLPKALALAESLQRHHPGASLTVLLIDAADNSELPELHGVELPFGVSLVGTDVLGLSRREIHHLAMVYDLVEFATAIKPLLLEHLLVSAEQAVYLDPDTFVTAPMLELPIDLAATSSGILLTPHFLEPVTEGALLTEGHLLTVGVYNLGFCAVDRRAARFLRWWWGHLRTECLFDPLSGLFVDQKWMDIGSSIFAATCWRHAGYNVSIANIHERPIALDDDGYLISSTGDRLRLFHFHSFDTSAPAELSTRWDVSSAHLRSESAALDKLCAEYADSLLRYERALPDAPAYVYARDRSGRAISRQLRRAYRVASEQSAGTLPSPFEAADTAAFAAWRRGAWRVTGRELAGDAVKSLRLALPEEYARIKKRLPGLSQALRSRLVRRSGIWG